MKGLLPLAILLVLPLSCRKATPSPGEKGAPEGERPQAKQGGDPVVLRFEGVEVTRNLVEPYVSFLLSRKPSLAPDSARRFILFRYALPMAWALKEVPGGFEKARARAERWIRAIRKGKTTLEAIAGEQLRAFGESPDQARPSTVLWTSLPLPLAQAVFSAPRGKVQGPLRTPQGWCLYRVDKIDPGLTRDRDLVTLLEVVVPPGGKAFWAKLRKFTRSLPLARGKFEVLDPAYKEVVPLILQKRGLSPKPSRRALNQGGNGR